MKVSDDDDGDDHLHLHDHEHEHVRRVHVHDHDDAPFCLPYWYDDHVCAHDFVELLVYHYLQNATLFLALLFLYELLS